jgi:hypothetical protein
LKGAFRKISRVGSLTGGTRWYLSDDCLLAAKRILYAVEYRRFYLRDLEYIMVWPSRLWLWRLIIPGLVFGALGVTFWQWINYTSGAIFSGVAVAWVAMEQVLGPTANSRIRTTGATIELPIVKRTRRARRVFAKIDAAVRMTRAVVEQPTAPAITTSPAEPTVRTSEAAATPTAAAIETNGS